jgi:prolipoprotein diacylglyceryltransferase
LLGIWGFELALAITIGVAFSARKALRNGSSLFSRSFRRFVLAMVPAVFSGALLTTVLFRNGDHALIPSVWLLLYGVSVSSGGAFSVRAVPLMGASFLVVGAIAAVSPAEWGDALMALGFGGLHIVFGYVIAKDFGG